MLDGSDKERLFREHVSILGEKKKKQFQKLLEETSEVGLVFCGIKLHSWLLLKITLVTPWKKARKLIKKDPRYELYGEDDKVSFTSLHMHIN